LPFNFIIQLHGHIATAFFSSNTFNNNANKHKYVCIVVCFVGFISTLGFASAISHNGTIAITFALFPFFIVHKRPIVLGVRCCQSYSKLGPIRLVSEAQHALFSIHILANINHFLVVICAFVISSSQS
jgi:hypothetical protein